MASSAEAVPDADGPAAPLADGAAAWKGCGGHEWVWCALSFPRGASPSTATLERWRTRLDGVGGTGGDGQAVQHASEPADTSITSEEQARVSGSTDSCEAGAEIILPEEMERACAPSSSTNACERQNSSVHSTTSLDNLHHHDSRSNTIVSPRQTHVIMVERTRDYQTMCRAALRAGETMIEVGSAYGDCLAAARTRHGATVKLIGVDCSAEAVTEATRRHPSIHFAVVDVLFDPTGLAGLATGADVVALDINGTRPAADVATVLQAIHERLCPAVVVVKCEELYKMALAHVKVHTVSLPAQVPEDRVNGASAGGDMFRCDQFDAVGGNDCTEGGGQDIADRARGGDGHDREVSFVGDHDVAAPSSVPINTTTTPPTRSDVSALDKDDKCHSYRSNAEQSQSEIKGVICGPCDAENPVVTLPAQSEWRAIVAAAVRRTKVCESCRRTFVYKPKFSAVWGTVRFCREGCLHDARDQGDETAVQGTGQVLVSNTRAPVAQRRLLRS